MKHDELDQHVNFCKQIRKTQLYQPIILVPSIIELLGKWDQATKDLSSSLCSYLKNSSILDLGCNTGFFLFEALRHGASEAWGIDNDVYMIDLANQIKNLTKTQVHFELANIELYVPNRHFDVILMMNVLDFVNNPIEQVSKYLDCCDIMIIEHEEEHEKLLGNHVFTVQSSPRAGGRILSFLRP